jgi:1-aminocyclopropane-1-carboxylate deaminase
MLGAEVRILDEGDTLSRDARPVLDELRARGQRPYWIPGGASMHALGGLGYARAAMEIAAQEKELRLSGSGRFDYVFVACGSGSTVGGLVAGFKLYEKMRTSSSSTASSSSTTTAANAAPPRQIIGVLNSPTNPKPYHETRVLTFARCAGALIGLDPETDLGVEDVRLDDRFVGTGYGVLDAEAREALETMARTEGVILDPVYTAKVARGMLHWVQQGEVVADARRNGNHLDEVNVLFIHTGGQAALGAYADVV